jgi:hypothetical protein
MPRPIATLSSIIMVTFICKKSCQYVTLTFFRVRRQGVLEALRWLRIHNANYCGLIEIDIHRLSQLPNRFCWMQENVNSLAPRSISDVEIGGDIVGNKYFHVSCQFKLMQQFRYWTIAPL